MTAAAPARDGASMLSRMADEADLCLTVLGPQQDRIVYTNAGFTKMLGFERAEAAGQPLGKLLTEDDLRAHRTFGANVPNAAALPGRVLRQDQGRRADVALGLFRRVFDEAGEAQATAVLLQDITESRIQALQRDALGCIAAGASLNELAGLICRHAEGLTPDVICSILSVDEAGCCILSQHPVCRRSIRRRSRGWRSARPSARCGTAAWRGEPVFVADIITDPLWEPYRALPLPPGLRGCWSTRSS